MHGAGSRASPSFAAKSPLLGALELAPKRLHLVLDLRELLDEAGLALEDALQRLHDRAVVDAADLAQRALDCLHIAAFRHRTASDPASAAGLAGACRRG